MFREIESASKPKSLVQQLVQRVLTDAGSRVKTIDDNRAMIAECETLAESLADNGLDGVRASVDVFDGYISANVLISGQPMSAIRDAAKGAGLHIYSETPFVFNGGDPLRPAVVHSVRIELTGFDCPFWASVVAQELAEAA